jgi:leucyl aminopeptidase
MPLKISVRSAQPHTQRADLLVVGVFTLARGGKKKDKADVLAPIDRALGGGLTRVIAKEEFKGKKEQVLTVPTLGKLKFEKVVLIGLGDKDSLAHADVRTFSAKAARCANGEKAKTLVLALPAGVEEHLRCVAEGLELGAYRFTKYLTGDRAPKASLHTVTVLSTVKLPPDAAARLHKGQVIAEGVNLSRDLSNEPSNAMTPELLAAAAAKVGKEKGLKTTIFDFKEIQKRGMKLIQAVGQGSVNEPRFVHLAWVPKTPKKRIVFVGKGVTFDSGGLSIKPAAGMGEMKHDMSGAANVIGLMSIIGALKPDVEVHGIAPLVENMPDGNAYRPGDIWGSLDGKSVEIINTDAEGRLILADALAYAAALEPDLLLDNATLTGACVVALGNTCSGWYANNDDTAQTFSSALKVTGENMWRLPLLDELKDQLKSDCADLKHTGDRWGGSITAALFLREFIGKTKNWIHVDIAGPAWTDRARGWDGKGATGHGVLTFLALVEGASGAAD